MNYINLAFIILSYQPINVFFLLEYFGDEREREREEIESLFFLGNNNNKRKS